MQHSSLTPALFEQLEQEIAKHWPTWKYLPENKDTLSVYDYAGSRIRSNPVIETSSRRKEFCEEIAMEVKRLFGESTAKSVSEQLKTNHSISTAQHYTPISSPKTLNPTIQTNLAYFGQNTPEKKHIIVLACAGISFTNHWNPRSYTFHTLTENGIVELQLPFFGRAMDPNPIISAPAYTKDSLKHMQKRIHHFQSERLLKKREVKQLQQVLDIIFSEEVLKQKDFVDQLSIQNYHIWNTLFSIYKNNPSLIFLSQERIALALLKKYHLHTKTILHHILFDTTYHDLLLKYFNNILCAFSLEKKYGTFLFWGVSKNSTQRIQLFPKNGRLVSNDKTFSLDLTPQALQKAIEAEIVIPSVMLTFLVLSLYYGLFLSGGLDQPWYLSEIKDAYIKMLTDLKENQELRYISEIIPNDSVITRASLAFLEDTNSNRIPASGLDLILYQKKDTWPNIIEASKHVVYKELLYRIYPELYKDYCENENKKEILLAITEQEIEKFTGIDKKIPAWVTLEDASSPHTT
jgi:hypothetical protein